MYVRFNAQCCTVSIPPLLGGELSGFCFILHSLKGTAACKRLMVRVGSNVKTNHNITTHTAHCVFFEHVVCV